MAASTLSIEYFPSTAIPDRPGVGIACSGGGSRALVATMGQLRALKALNLLDKVTMISSVSGGTWAAALFTYLPDSISDDDFLGPVVAPGAITVPSLGSVGSTNLGLVPQRLSLDRLTQALLKCIANDYAPCDYWQGIVGDCILQPFGLWNINATRRPTKYFAWTVADAQAIVARNPGLDVSDFYVVDGKRPRPRLIMNGAMFSNPTLEHSQLLPFQSSPTGIGIAPFFKGQGVYGRDIGGGLIETLGMGSEFIKPQGTNQAQVTMPPRRFSLSDMAAISSAAFAQILQAQLSHLWDPLAQTIVPTYPYWPVGSTSTQPWRYEFADGGCLENTGIPTLLSDGIRNIIAFINQQTPIQNAIESQISDLFGEPPGAISEPYMIPLPTPGVGQVFHSSDYAPLVEGLRKASTQGPAMFLQTLETVPNSNFGVPQCQVRVLWICNAWVDAWYNALQPNVQLVVDQQRKLFQFPYYDTINQLDMSPTQVNLLAHLSCWGLQTNAQVVRSVFDA